MRLKHLVKLVLAVAGYLAGPPAWAQRAAVAPLAPLPPVVRPMSPNAQVVGVPAETQPPRAAPTTYQERLTARPALPEPVYLLNSRFIINELGNLNPQDIATVDIYKTAAGTPAQWRSLTKQGIVAITLKPGVRLKLKSKSLAAIRRQAKVSGPVSFQLNGLPLEDPSLRVAAAIAGLDLWRRGGETVLNIRLAPPKPPLPRHDPPGTIYIRGVASR